MKKETDLNGVRAIAKTLLMIAVNRTPYSPVLVQHPLTYNGLVALPSEKYEGFQPIDITLNEENLKRWQESISQTIDETENPYHIYITGTKSIDNTYQIMLDYFETLISLAKNKEIQNALSVMKSDYINAFKFHDIGSLFSVHEVIHDYDYYVVIYPISFSIKCVTVLNYFII